MKTITNRLAIFAAAAVVLSTMAFGQTRSMKVQIPFEFKTAEGTLPAGNYWVTTETTSGGKHAVLNNIARKHPVIILSSFHDYRALGSTAVLFRCGQAGCVLNGIRGESGTTVYNSSHSKRDKEVAILVVPAVGVKAD